MKKIILAVIMLAGVYWFSSAVAENEYWDNGKIRMSTEYNAAGEMTEKTSYDYDGNKEKEEKFDNAGRKILLANYDKEGRLKTGIDGWACMRWKYEDGNMIGEGYYGQDGKLLEYKRYNAEGDLVDKKYFGGKEPDASEEYEPIPTLAGESMEFYDEYGKEEGSTGITYDEPFFPYTFFYDE